MNASAMLRAGGIRRGTEPIAWCLDPMRGAGLGPAEPDRD